MRLAGNDRDRPGARSVRGERRVRRPTVAPLRPSTPSVRRDQESPYRDLARCDRRGRVPSRALAAEGRGGRTGAGPSGAVRLGREPDDDRRRRRPPRRTPSSPFHPRATSRAPKAVSGSSSGMELALLSDLRAVPGRAAREGCAAGGVRALGRTGSRGRGAVCRTPSSVSRPRPGPPAPLLAEEALLHRLATMHAKGPTLDAPAGYARGPGF